MLHGDVNEIRIGAAYINMMLIFIMRK